MELWVNETKLTGFWAGDRAFDSGFRPSGSKSYRDFRETGPSISLKTEHTGSHGKEARPPCDAMYLPKNIARFMQARRDTWGRPWLYQGSRDAIIDQRLKVAVNSFHKLSNRRVPLGTVTNGNFLSQFVHRLYNRHLSGAITATKTDRKIAFFNL